MKKLVLLTGLFALSGALLASCGGGGGSTETTFTISFDSNGGSAVSSITVKYGEKATKPADPTKSGVTFDGWFVDKALKVSFNWNQEITADWQLYAGWNDGGQASQEEQSEQQSQQQGTSQEQGQESQQQGTSQQQGDKPTAEGYYVVVAGTTYVPLTGGEPWSYDPTFVEYSALNVHVEKDQLITFYHVDDKGAGAGWNTMKIDSASKGGWTSTADGLKCGETNDYDMYVKMKYQADNIYFGYHS